MFYWLINRSLPSEPFNRDTIIHIAPQNGAITNMVQSTYPNTLTANLLTVSTHGGVPVISTSSASGGYCSLSNLDQLKSIGTGNFEIEWEVLHTSFNDYHMVCSFIRSGRVGLAVRHTVKSGDGYQLGWDFGSQSAWANVSFPTAPTTTIDASYLNKWIKCVYRRFNGQVTFDVDGRRANLNTVAGILPYDLSTTTKAFILGTDNSIESSVMNNGKYKYIKVSKLIPK